MRELKFRAWFSPRNRVNEEPDSMAYFTLEDSWNYRFENMVDIMQYTGLKDKNGKEIYEGDILCVDRTKSKFERKSKHDFYIVGYKNGCFVTESYNGDFKVYPQLNHRSDFKIIGNIYENAELLGNK